MQGDFEKNKRASRPFNLLEIDLFIYKFLS